jgi:hypothetical protein
MKTIMGKNNESKPSLVTVDGALAIAVALVD